MHWKSADRTSIWQPTHVAQIFLGPALWAVWFVILYGGLSVACALVPPPTVQGAMSWLNVSLAVITLCTTAVLLWWAWRCWRAGSASSTSTDGLERFIAKVGASIHVFSAGVTLIIGLPVVALPPCV